MVARRGGAPSGERAPGSVLPVERTAVLVHRLVLATAALLVIALMAQTGALAAAAPGAPSASANDAPTSPEVEAEVRSGVTEVVALTRAPGSTVATDVVEGAPTGSVTDVEAGRAKAVAATVDAAGLDALQASPEVERILPNRTHRIAYDAWVDTVGAPAAHDLGWDGAGQTIAVLDSGVQSDHPYLTGKVVAEACFSRDSVVGGARSLCDGGVERRTDVAGSAAPCSGIAGCDHGTHVAGIAAGGPLGSPRDLVGTAPGASIVAIKVFTEGTTTAACNGVAPCLLAYDSDIIAALDWLVERRDAGDPRFASLAAVNLSLGGGLYAGVCDDAEPTAPVIAALRDDGVATVAAAGNNGANGTVSAPRMAAPACISSVVSVGAVTQTGSLASYSNLTSTTTLLAPGTSISSSVPTSTWSVRTGTSMATPMVSGAIADLREHDPTASVDAMVRLLEAAGDPVSTPVGDRPQLRVDRATGVLSPNLPPGPPIGSLDSVGAGVGEVSVSGWVIDPDTVAGTSVEIVVDGATVATVAAEGARPDVGVVYPGYGPDHGYATTVTASPGTREVCVRARNVGVGTDAVVGCGTTQVLSRPPLGSLGAGYHAVVPARLVDTRIGQGAPAGPLDPFDVLAVPVTGAGGLPVEGISAVVLNVTAVEPASNGYIGLWPTGSAPPPTSNLNYVAGDTTPNLVTVAVGPDGSVELGNAFGTTDVLVDVAGWFDSGPDQPGGTGLHTLTPTRLLDTRDGIGGVGDALGPDSSIDLAVTDVAGIPAVGVTAVALNVTVTDTTSGGYLTVSPTGATRPFVSNLNWAAGATVANMVVATVGAGGAVELYNSHGSTEVVVDVVGWFDDGSGPAGPGGLFHPVSPDRALDTRDGTGAPAAPLGPDSSIAVQFAGAGGVPASGAGAVLVNTTATATTSGGYLTVWPDGIARPTASILNWAAGETRANLVLTPLSAAGRARAHNAFGTTHVVGDVAGWFDVPD